jgi:hypothetical protein
VEAGHAHNAGRIFVVAVADKMADLVTENRFLLAGIRELEAEGRFKQGDTAGDVHFARRWLGSPASRPLAAWVFND